MSKTARRWEDMPLTAPNSGGNVWPMQSCPAFTVRGGAAENTCWYCAYADFHLDKPRALDVGICNKGGINYKFSSSSTGKCINRCSRTGYYQRLKHRSG